MPRTKQPIDLVKAKGNKHLTKAEYEARKSVEVHAPDDKIKPPTYLNREEKRKFKTISDQLVEIGIMSNLDCDVLARYVRANTEYVKVTKELEKITLEDKDYHPEADDPLYEYAKYDKLLNLQQKTQKMCLECAREMGLTIASRCKLVLPKKEEKKPENKFLRNA